MKKLRRTCKSQQFISHIALQILLHITQWYRAGEIVSRTQSNQTIMGPLHIEYLGPEWLTLPRPAAPDWQLKSNCWFQQAGSMHLLARRLSALPTLIKRLTTSAYRCRPVVCIDCQTQSMLLLEGC